jgi:basic amino acid/polyamine antiporter, APA family
LVAAAVSALTALSFVHLSAFIPREGGGYEYAHELVSPFGGFISGWMWLLSNIVAGAAVALGLAGYLALYIPLPVNLMAAIACIGITAINYWGVKESSVLNNVLVIFKLFVLFLFVAFGIGLIVGSNFTPFAPFGPLGIMEGASVIFFAFSGFGRVAMLSEEVKDPTRTVPRAIILALGISVVIYILVSGVALGLVGYPVLASSSSPLASAAEVESTFMANLMAVGAMAATLSVLLTTLLGVSRITFAMSRNHDLPAFLAKVHPKRGTPYISVLILGSLMTVFALTTNILAAVAISNFGSLVYYMLANLAAIKMRVKLTTKMLATLGLISCGALMVFLTSGAWLLGIGALGIGSLYYYFGVSKAKKRGAVPGP